MFYETSATTRQGISYILGNLPVDFLSSSNGGGEKGKALAAVVSHSDSTCRHDNHETIKSIVHCRGKRMFGSPGPINLLYKICMVMVTTPTG
jgi:hypothetical protein